jgi:hypothetical protein
MEVRSAIDFVDEGLVIDGLVDRVIEPIEKLMEGLAGTAHESREHVVVVAGHGGAIDRLDAPDTDVTVVVDELFDVGPRRARRWRLGL